MNVRIGLGQILVRGGDPAGNLARARTMIGRAGSAGCQVVVLPECLDCGWTHPSARELAAPVPGPTTDALAAAARAARLYVVAGVTERAGALVYNASVLLDPDGGLLLHHRKINELDIALDLYARGDRLGVARTGIGTIAIPICADNFPESIHLARSLIAMGAELILSPCAWAVDAGHDNSQDPYGGLWLGAYNYLAWQFPVVVCGVSAVGWLEVGPWAGRKLIGSSLAVGPGARLLAQGPYGPEAEALITLDVRLSG